MALFSQYKCKHCGFEILTSPTFYYRTMIAYGITRKCSCCKEIIHETFGLFDLPRFDNPEEFFKWIENEDFHTKNGVCPDCHKKTRLTLWSPTTNRCPKCGRYWLTCIHKNIMCVD